MNFLKRGTSQEAVVALTPLIDIIFLLIIFFLVSSTFETNEKALDISLPGTKGGRRSQETRQWYFNVRADGAVVFGGTVQDLPAIDAWLRARRDERNDTTLIVRADGKVRYEIVAKLLGMFSEYGYSRVAFQTVDDRG